MNHKPLLNLISDINQRNYSRMEVLQNEDAAQIQQ